MFRVDTVSSLNLVSFSLRFLHKNQLKHWQNKLLNHNYQVTFTILIFFTPTPISPACYIQRYPKPVPIILSKGFIRLRMLNDCFTYIF